MQATRSEKRKKITWSNFWPVKFKAICTIIRAMYYRFKKIHAWLLILALAISAAPGGFASDISQPGHGDDCPMMQTFPADIDAAGCQQTGDDQCRSTLCTQHNTTSLQTQITFQLAARAECQAVIAASRRTISSHYPNLLKRPPKA